MWPSVFRRRLRPTCACRSRPPRRFTRLSISWTGLYLGLHAGYGFGNDSNLGIAGFTNNNGDGFLGGAQIGFDYQFAPNWVAGVEGQISWIDADRSWTGPGVVLSRQADWLGSVTGRLGYTWGPGLLYVKGGAAWTNDDYSLVIGGVPGVFTGGSNSTGWTLGAGLEYMFAPSWSAKIEYQYYDFGNTTLVGSGPVRNGRERRQQHPHRQARCELPLQLGALIAWSI